MRLIINSILIILVIHFILDEFSHKWVLPLNEIFSPYIKKFGLGLGQQGYGHREYYRGVGDEDGPSSAKHELLRYIRGDDMGHDSESESELEYKSNDSSHVNGRMFNIETRASAQDNGYDKWVASRDSKYEMGVGQVKEGNYYTTDFNTPNFESNVMDIPQFYSQNSNQLGAENMVGNRNSDMNQGGKTTDDGYISWDRNNLEYKNDFVMNGANFFNGVSGWQEDDELSLYEQIDGGRSEMNRMNGKEKGKVDDIRFGLGTPNSIIRQTT